MKIVDGTTSVMVDSSIEFTSKWRIWSFSVHFQNYLINSEFTWNSLNNEWSSGRCWPSSFNPSPPPLPVRNSGFRKRSIPININTLLELYKYKNRWPVKMAVAANWPFMCVKLDWKSRSVKKWDEEVEEVEEKAETQKNKRLSAAQWPPTRCQYFARFIFIRYFMKTDWKKLTFKKRALLEKL